MDNYCIRLNSMKWLISDCFDLLKMAVSHNSTQYLERKLYGTLNFLLSFCIKSERIQGWKRPPKSLTGLHFRSTSCCGLIFRNPALCSTEPLTNAFVATDMSGFTKRSTSDNLQEKIRVVLNWSVHEAMEGMYYLDSWQSKEPLTPSSPGSDILTKA